MRWPHRKKPAGAPEPRSDGPATDAPGASAVAVAPAPIAPIAPHPEHSRPRPDWAHVGPMAPIVSAPPLTFDGARFGRSVAGARPITAPRHHLPSGRSAPSGVMRDAVTVDGVITPADAIARDVATHGAGVMPAAPPAAHRKALAGKREQAAGLVTSDFELQYPTAELRRPPIAPVTWTLEEGFVEEAPEAGPAASMTMFRRRAPIQRAGDDDDAIDEEFEDDHPGVRFVPARGPRRIAPPRDLVDIVEQVTGVHVGDTIIDRSPMVSERAAELGAVAFTEGGTVHLPAELGDIDNPDVRGIAAHELVHVAQHRALQGELPHEDSPEGRRLEAEARTVQRSLGQGAPVVPAFIRSAANLPVHRTEAPTGVQRLVNEASGEDFSDVDLSEFEPGSGGDRFLWQEREGEPFNVPWDERRQWDERFETEQSTTLQGKRIDRHGQLINEVVGGAQPTSEQLLEVRRRLDVEMPYQFGPPFGIEPYPQLLPGEAARTAGAGGAGGAGGGGGGGGTGAALAGGARALTATAPVQTAAETGRANEALVHIAAQAHERHRLRGDHEGSLVELIDERFQLERTMRLEVLHAMREAAIAEGAAQDHVVALNDDEIARIRAAVDVEIPLNVPYPQYLENAAMHMSVAGLLDGPLPTGGTAGARATGTGTTGAPTTGGTPGTTAPGTGAGTGTGATTPTAGAGDAQSRLTDILNEARNNAGQARLGRLSGGDWLEIYQERFNHEKTLREQVLNAKVEGAVHAGTDVGMMVHLDQNELNQIHQAVDIEYPVNLEQPSYLDTDEFLSHQITDEDVTRYGREVQAPTTQSATAPATDATTTAAPGTPTTPGGTTTPTPTGAGAPAEAEGGAPAQSHSTGAVALATGITGLLAAMHHGEDHAADELAGTVVESLTEVDIEMLSRRLWERLRRELRTELLIDRERAGALADIR